MIIVDPVVLGDAACTRASPKWVFNRTGTLVEVPVDTLGVTYDPSDLTKAPYALLEEEGMNRLIWSEQFDNPVWAATSIVTPTLAADVASPKGDVTAYKLIAAPGKPSFRKLRTGDSGVTVGELRTFSVFVKAGELSQVSLQVNAYGGNYFNAAFDLLAGSRLYQSLLGAAQDVSSGIVSVGNGWWRIWVTGIPWAGDNKFGTDHDIFLMKDGTSFFDDNGASGLYVFGANVTRGGLSSYIPSAGAMTIRSADVISNTAGLVYSNVPMVEPPYSAATTYAKDAAVYDPASKIVYWSMQAANLGKPLSDPAWWNKRTAINRWAMFDDRNSTVSSNPEEIIAVVSARAITHGMFAGALDASEVRVSMSHPTRGLVYSEVRNLVLPRSGSSFFGWCFNRLRLRTWFLTLKLPVFANALVTITIRKPGSVAKCGMCMIGPAIDVGLSMMGLSTELKDYSTTTFFPDGSSDTIPRGFSKRMSVDLSVERDQVETIEDDLIKRRQKTLVWLGSTLRGDTMLVGKFSSFRKVIDSYPRSKMALQIEGVLSQ